VCAALEFYHNVEKNTVSSFLLTPLALLNEGVFIGLPQLKLICFDWPHLEHLRFSSTREVLRATPTDTLVWHVFSNGAVSPHFFFLIWVARNSSTVDFWSNFVKPEQSS
jgi:hypothetical protein